MRTEEGVEEDFHYVTPNVVLATGGFDLPNRINVAGEHHSFVIKSLAVMEQLIASRKLSSSSDPVLIVGAGEKFNQFDFFIKIWTIFPLQTKVLTL